MSQPPDQTPGEQDTERVRDQAPPSTARDMGITILFIALAVGFLIASRQFAGDRISETDPGAAFWPRVTLLILLVAGVVNLGLLYRHARTNDEPLINGGIDNWSHVLSLSEEQRQYLLAIGLVIVFLVSLEHIGFLVASPLFLFAFAYAIGYRDLGKLSVFSLAVALIVFFAFRNVMNIALPYGSGVFREISVIASNLF